MKLFQNRSRREDAPCSWLCLVFEPRYLGCYGGLKESQMKRFFRKYTQAAAVMALLLSGLAIKALGYPTNYGPFAPGHEPAAIRFNPCELVRDIKPQGDDNAGAVREYRLSAGALGRRQIALALRGTTHGWEINLRDDRGRHLLPAPFTNRMTTLQMKVDACDLN